MTTSYACNNAMCALIGAHTPHCATPKKSPVRMTEWGNWGITFYWVKADTREAVAFEGKLEFPVGAQGPMDGYIGSPQRQRYIDACAQWMRDGQLPDGTVCAISQKWLYAAVQSPAPAPQPHDGPQGQPNSSFSSELIGTDSRDSADSIKE